MRLTGAKNNNKGFSLIELIVVIAIMTVTIGAVVISVSLISGSDAKEASRKFNSQIDEVRTGSMSRYDENISIMYLEKDPDNGIDSDGYYTVKKITTITEDATAKKDPTDPKAVGTVKPKVIGEEHRYLCRSRVKITVGYVENGVNKEKTITAQASDKGFTLNYDRQTGLFKSLEINGVEVPKSELRFVDFEAGIRHYNISFVQETGKHQLKTVNS